MAELFEMVDASFGKDIDAEIEQYLFEQIEWLERSHQDLHKTRLPKWRRLYNGTPAEENKSFPWPNASNVIVQVVGETVDTMAARVLGLLYATHPLWIFQNFLKTSDLNMAEKRRRVLEDFLDLVGYEPGELDLYRVEGQWFTDAARLGTSFLKLALENIVEAVVVGHDAATKKFKGREETLYSGPRVLKLRHENVLAGPAAQTLAESRVVAHIRPLKRDEFEERGFTGFYDKGLVRKLLSSPDRSNPRETQRQELQDEGITTTPTVESTAEWDVYECYFPWWYRDRKYRLIYSYHKKSRTVLRRVFNFLPQNSLPILRAKLGYRTDGLYGHGYAELLERYQEELSSVHNQRIDNATVANIRALRVSPRARNLDANFELYPGALIVGEKDEVEALQVGDVYPSSFKNEEMGLSMVQRRSGIQPAISGFGTGGMMKRPAIYSSGATLAVMQESNSRVGHATSEFRHAHVMLGEMLTKLYARFGTAGREQAFGLDSGLLLDALKEFEQHHLRIPIRASDGSVNREIAKQNDVVVLGLVQRHFTATGQLMQALGNPMLPQELREYFVKVIQSSDALMKRILKDFGYDQPDQYIPEPLPAGQNQAAGGGGQMAQAGPPVGGDAQAAAGAGGGLVPVSGGTNVPAGSPSAPIPGAR